MIRYYYEDLQTGSKVDIGPYLVTREEIIAFAEEFDPAPFHLSEEGGKASVMGGLCCLRLAHLFYRHANDVRQFPPEFILPGRSRRS